MIVVYQNFPEQLQGPENKDAIFNPTLETGTNGFVNGDSTTNGIIVSEYGTNVCISSTDYMAMGSSHVTTYYPAIIDYNVNTNDSTFAFTLSNWNTKNQRSNIPVAINIRITPSIPLHLGLAIYYNGSPCSSLMMTPEWNNDMMVFSGFMSLFNEIPGKSGSTVNNQPSTDLVDVPLELHVVNVDPTTGNYDLNLTETVTMTGCFSILIN